MSQTSKTTTMVILILLFAVAGLSLGAEEDVCRVAKPDGLMSDNGVAIIESTERGVYSGYIRVYVTEITGRWDDDDNVPFDNAFLSFALQQSVLLVDDLPETWDVVWNGNNYYDAHGNPFDDITEDNIRVYAAIFNSQGYQGYSDPPSGAPFTVYEVDACAAAECGETGYNVKTSAFTHTVFIEDASTDW